MVLVPSVLELLPLVPLVAVMVPKLLVEFAVLQSDPAVADPQPTLGLLKRGVFVRPNISARNWKVKRSVMAKLRNTLTSASKIPGPLNWLRCVLPNTPRAGCAKTAGSK